MTQLNRAGWRSHRMTTRLNRMASRLARALSRFARVTARKHRMKKQRLILPEKTHDADAGRPRRFSLK
jgi:hypothetical protein